MIPHCSIMYPFQPVPYFVAPSGPGRERARAWPSRPVAGTLVGKARSGVKTMSAPAAVAAAPRTDATAEYDAIIIGAGIAGMYQLFRLRQRGLSVRVFETGTGVGGTWYWNRYPGARFDSESYTYGYAFDEQLLQDWDWSEHFAAQPETLRYLNHVADRFDLRRDIQFNSRVAAAHWQEATRSWNVTLEDGSLHRARFLITAIGPLSAP